MILASMTPKELFDNLDRDSKKVMIRIDKIYPKAVKFFKRSSAFPAWFMDEYKIPSTNNQYIIFFYASKRDEAEKPRYRSFCIVFFGAHRFVIRGMRMGYKHTPQSEFIMLPQIHVFTSHFLQRYKERFLCEENLTTNEIAGLFLVRNPKVVPIQINEEVNRNYKNHGENSGIGMRVPDGFCFTQTALEGQMSEDGNRNNDIVGTMIIVYTTFMKESEMSDTQRAAVNKEHLETLKHCAEVLSSEKSK